MAQPRKSFRTEKGTELPILNLKNKEYLQVMHRIQWFREANPNGLIKTTMLAMQGEGQTEYAVFKAEIFIDTERGPMLVASGHKKETRGGFDDFIEKAETGAVGRALALCGYGTQFASDDLDEGTRLADSPAPVLDKTTVTSKQVEETFRNGITAVAEKVKTEEHSRSSFRKTPVTVKTSTVASTDDI